MRPLLITAIAFATVPAGLHGQDSKDTQAAEPGPGLAHLKPFVGTWELTVEGVKEKGSAEIKSILGGKFVTEDVKLSFGGIPMEWHGVYGFDRAKKQYTGLWFDNMANTTRSDSGEVDKTGRVLTFRGEHAGNAKYLWRLSHDGKKAMTIEMFDVAKDGKESLVMKVSGEKK